MDKSAEKKTIMDYLPEHERAKLRKLVQRLAEQTEQKQKFKALYEQMCQKYQLLTTKYEELEEHANDLKSQIATSKMAINKARQAYVASLSAKKSKRQTPHAIDEASDHEHSPSLQNLKQTWLKIPKPTQSMRPEHCKKQFIFQLNENNQSQSNFNLNFSDKSYPSIPLPLRNQNSAPQKTKKKFEQELDLQTSSKKQQIMSLRKEIETLTEQMEKKQMQSIPFNEKMKKCEEIKNRYLRSKEKRKKLSDQNSSEDDERFQVEEKNKRLKESPSSNNKISNCTENNVRKSNKQLIKSIQSVDGVERLEKNEKIKERGQKIEKKGQLNVIKKSVMQKNKANNESWQEGQVECERGEEESVLRGKGRRNGNEHKMKLDESLFAIIDQLNSGN